MRMVLRSSRYVVHSCKHHVEWCPKHRRKVLMDGIDERLKAFICSEVAERDAAVIEMEGRLPTLWTNSYSSRRWGARRLWSSNNRSKTRRRPECTPSSVCELPLRVPWSLGRCLAAKFDAARPVYNACLAEVLRRLDLVRQSGWFAKGRATPRPQKVERKAHFRAAREQHAFSDAALQRYAIRPRSKDGTGRSAPKTWIGEYLGAHEVQTLVSRAYRATNTTCSASMDGHAAGRARNATAASRT